MPRLDEWVLRSKDGEYAVDQTGETIVFWNRLRAVHDAEDYSEIRKKTFKVIRKPRTLDNVMCRLIP